MDVRASSMSSTDELEPVELLDDYWFFHNLFRKKNQMFRSSSDPYPSSNSMDEVFAMIKGKESSQSTNLKLQKTPSLPVSVGRVKRMEEDPNKESAETESTNHLSKENGLQRMPSLPLRTGTGKDKGMGETRRSSKLTRQTSLSSSNVLPPLHASKGAAPSSAIPPKRLMRRETMVERTGKDGKPRLYIPKDMMHRSLSQNKMSKSPTELETEEVQGFKDLGFDFDKIDLNPSVADIIPGLQSKKPDYWKEDKVRRPYLSEAWVVQKSTPLTVMPDLIVPGSAGDMKKHLKYWARAVASNMRQEC